jgi:hypothetical protein
MALLIAAVDRRIKVIAAGHPGGSMEATYLTGRELTNLDLLSLIPPRPCRMIVGDASGEAPRHGEKLNDMARFYKGLGVSEDHWNISIVEGKHDYLLPKRLSVYEWMNQWFDKNEEGKEEPPLEVLISENLWCTDRGIVNASLNGESGQTLNQKRGERIYPGIRDAGELKERISKKLHLDIPDDSEIPAVQRKESFRTGSISVEKFVFVSEPGIEVPALLIRPSKKEKKQMVIHVSIEGKPQDPDRPSVPVNLAKAGYPVLSIDVRGTGETANHPPAPKGHKYISYTLEQFDRDVMAAESAAFGRTILAMRTLDVIKAIDLILAKKEFKNRPLVVAGEGIGGL